MPYSPMSEPPAPGASNQPAGQSSICRICDDWYTSVRVPVSLSLVMYCAMSANKPGVSRNGTTKCPFCRHHYLSTDVRRIYNDAEAVSEIKKMINEFNDRVRIMMNEHQEVTSTLRSETEELRQQFVALKTERDQLAQQLKWFTSDPLELDRLMEN